MTRRSSLIDPRDRSYRWVGAVVLFLMGSLPVALLLAQEKSSNETQPKTTSEIQKDQAKQPSNVESALTTKTDDRAEAKEISFNFSDTPWEEIARWLAEIGKKSLLVEAKPTGSFTYFDTRKYSFNEALDVINSVLLTKGHILLVRNNFLILADLKEGIPPHLVDRVDVKDLPKRGRTELVKVLLTLKGLVSDEAKKEFESMSSPYGKIISLPSTNQLLIVDTAQNVQQIVGLIAELEGDEGKADLRAFPLKHVSARDIERVVRDLLGLGSKEENAAASSQASANQQGGRGNRGGGGGGDRGDRFREMMQQMMGGQGGPPAGPPQAGPPQANRNPNGPFVSVDERTNTLFVSATPDKLALVAQVVQRLDVPQDEDGKMTEQTPRIEVYPVTAGDAEGLSQVLQSVFQASADLKVTAHPDGRSLLIYATPRDHERIKTVLAQIKSEGLRVEVVPLRTLDATNTATLIRALLGQKAKEGPRMRFSFFDRSEEETATGGPWVEPDAERNRLVLRGTEAQIRDIRNLLIKLGETGLASDAEGNLGSGKYRVIPLGGQDPKETADTVRRLWQRLAPQSPVRVEIVGSRKGKPSPPEGEKRSIEITPKETNEKPSPKPQPILPDQSRRWSIPWQNSRSTPSHQTASGDIQLAGYVDQDEDAAENMQPPDETPVEEPVLPSTENLPRDNPSTETLPADDGTKEKSEPSTEKPDGNGMEKNGVTIVVGPDNLTLFADDPKMLDMLENLLNTVVRGEQTSQFAYYYLKVADAQETALMLDQALYGEQQRSSFFFTQEEKPNRARILPDTRANALLVVGPPAEQRKIEQLLEVVDEVERPSSAATPKPHVIPVVYGNATEVAEVVRSVFAQQLFDNRRQQQQRINVPSFGGFGGFGMGGGGGRGNNNQNQNQSSSGKLTVGVNVQTNSIVVSAPQEIFKEVERLVKSLDEAAAQQGRSARVVTLKNASPEAVEKALGNLFGVRTTAELEEERKERAKMRAEEEDKQNPNSNNRRTRQQELEDTIRNFGNQVPGGMGIPGGGFGGPRFFPF